MGLFDTPIGGSVGGVGGTFTLGALGEGLKRAGQDWVNQKLAEYYTAKQFAQGAPGALYGALPKFDIQAGPFSVSKSTPSTLTSLTSRPQPPAPHPPQSVTPPPAPAPDQEQYTPGPPATIGEQVFPPTPPTVGGRGRGSMFQPGGGVPVSLDELQFSSPGGVAQSAQFPQGISQAAPAVSKGPGFGSRLLSAAAGFAPLIQSEFEKHNAPGNDRPFAQMGYYDEKDRQQKAQEEYNLAQLQQQGATQREQMGNEAGIQREQETNRAMFERQRAEDAAKLEQIAAEGRARMTYEHPITQQQAEAMGLPAEMVGMPMSAAVQYADSQQRSKSLADYYSNQERHQQQIEEQAVRTQKQGYLQALYRAMQNPLTLTQPGQREQIQSQIRALEHELYPQLPQAPMGAPPQAQAQPPAGPGFASQLGQAAKNAWNYISSGGQADRNAPTPPPTASNLGSSGGLPTGAMNLLGGGQNTGLVVSPQAMAADQAVSGLQLSEGTRRALKGILIEHQNPIDVNNAVGQLLKDPNTLPEERNELLKFQAQFRR